MGLFDKVGGDSLFGGTTAGAFDAPKAKETLFVPDKPAGGLFDKEERIENPFDDIDANAPEGEGIEAYSERVFTVAELEFKKRAQVEQKRMLDAVDTEYWFALCFQTREQKLQFLERAGILPLGDKYLYGPDVAKAMSIELDPVSKRYNISDKLDGKLSELARPLNGE